MSSSRQVQFDSSLLGTITEEFQAGSGIFKSNQVFGSPVPQKSPAQLYFNKHRIMESIEELVHELASKLPDDPYLSMSERFGSMAETGFPPALSSKKSVLSIASHIHANVGTSMPSTTIRRLEVEVKLPPGEIDEKFPSYLSELASSVRRSTT